MYFARITEVLANVCHPLVIVQVTVICRVGEASKRSGNLYAHRRGTLSVYLLKVYADKLEWPTDAGSVWRQAMTGQSCIMSKFRHRYLSFVRHERSAAEPWGIIYHVYYLSYIFHSREKNVQNLWDDQVYVMIYAHCRRNIICLLSQFSKNRQRDSSDSKRYQILGCLICTVA